MASTTPDPEFASPSDELQVLIRCGRDWASDATSAVGDGTLDGNVDWGNTIRLARRHGMEPLLVEWLQGTAHERLPEDAYSTLEHRHERLLRRNLTVIAELLDLTERLESAGVRCLAYKGPLIASRAYGNATIRGYTDLDVLVAPADRQRARELLESRGYELQQINHAVAQSVFAHPEKVSPIDLHARVTPEFFPVSLPFDDLYARSEPVDVGGRSVRGFSTPDAILVHSIHGAKHHWFRIEWLVAVASLVHRYDDLPELLDRADRLGCERMVLLATVLSRRLFGVSLPPAVRRRLDRNSAEMRAVRTAAGAVVDWSTEEWSQENEKRTHLADFYFRSQLVSGPVDTARFWGTALTKPRPEDWRAVSLPEPLSPLYRVVRPLRLLYEYRRTLARRLFG